MAIDSVWVHERGAIVERAIEVDGSKQRLESEPIEISGLPLALSDTSVRLWAEDAEVFDVEVVLAGAPAEESNAALLAMERRIADKSHLLQALDREIDLLGRLAAAEAPTIAARAHLADAADTAIEIKVAETREARRALEELVEATARLEKAEPANACKVVQARLRGQASKLHLSYAVAGARWVPGYRCRAEGGRVTLGAQALVRQLSGEDWTGTKLRFSAYELEAASAFAIPELEPWRIGERKEKERSRGAGLGRFADHDRALTQIADGRAFASLVLLPLEGSADPAPTEIIRLPERPSIEPHFGSSAPSPWEDTTDEHRVLEPSSLETVDIEVVVESGEPDYSEVEIPPAREAGRALRRRRAQPNLMTLALGPAADPALRGKLSPIRTNAPSLEQAADRAFARASAEVPLPQGAHELRPTPMGATSEVLADVPSDGEYHAVALEGISLEGELYYVALPRETSEVFRAARFRNTSDSALLPGPVEIVVDGEYIKTAPLPTVPPGGTIELSLGVEPELISRRRHRSEERKQGGRTEVWHAVEVEIANNLPREIQCEVRERVPRLAVEELRSEPAWETYTQAERGRAIEGGRRWVSPVAPQSRKTFSAEYSVRV